MKPCRYRLSCKQCRSRSAGFWRSQLIRIHTVFNATCELIIINLNMKIQNFINFITNFALVQGQVNWNFQLVLNEMGPGRTSRAWYFHSPVSWILFVLIYLQRWTRRQKSPLAKKELSYTLKTSTQQGSHINSKTQFHFSMIFHDQQWGFHDYLMHRIQPPLLAASSPCWA